MFSEIYKQNRFILCYTSQHHLLYFISNIVARVYASQQRWHYFLTSRESKERGLQSYLFWVVHFTNGKSLLPESVHWPSNGLQLILTQMSTPHPPIGNIAFAFHILMGLTDYISRIISSYNHSSLLFSLLIESEEQMNI